MISLAEDLAEGQGRLDGTAGGVTPSGSLFTEPSGQGDNEGWEDV